VGVIAAVPPFEIDAGSLAFWIAAASVAVSLRLIQAKDFAGVELLSSSSFEMPVNAASVFAAVLGF